MTSLEELTAQQREINEIVSTLRAMLSTDQVNVPTVASVARVLLCDLCRKVRKHLVEEDEELYPSLMAHADLQIQHLAWGFRAGDRPLRQQFESYAGRWLKGYRLQFTEAFLEETMELLDSIQGRIEREQMVMMPHLKESGFFAVVNA
jgi:hypothetical protein